MRSGTCPTSRTRASATSVVYWFRTTLRNDGAQPQRRLYEIAAPLLAHLDVHVLDEQQRLLHHWALGDKRNFESRPVAHRHFVVPIDALPQQTLTVLARVATEGTVQMPVRVWTPAAARAEHGRDRQPRRVLPRAELGRRRAPDAQAGGRRALCIEAHRAQSRHRGARRAGVVADLGHGARLSCVAAVSAPFLPSTR
jgi:7TMR-DISM extracellular 2